MRKKAEQILQNHFRNDKGISMSEDTLKEMKYVIDAMLEFAGKEIVDKNRYYYKHEISQCKEVCLLYSPRKIGSIRCQLCPNYICGDTKEHWIKCERIKEATGQ